MNFVGAAEPECPRIRNVMTDLLSKNQVIQKEFPICREVSAHVAADTRKRNDFGIISVSFIEAGVDTVNASASTIPTNAEDVESNGYQKPVRLFKRSKSLFH